MRYSISALALLVAAATNAHATSAKLAVTPLAGTAPLSVKFDTAGSDAVAPQQHFLLYGNGGFATLASASEKLDYRYDLPGFYTAQTWLKVSDSDIALAPPLGIAAARARDGLAPATVAVNIASLGSLAYQFSATVTPTPADAVAGRAWDFGDGTMSGEESPRHLYSAPGVYQVALYVTSRAGLPAIARQLIVVGTGAVAPSMLLFAEPQDQLPLTPIKVSALLEGVAANTMVKRARVRWPDFDDVSPRVTMTSTGIVIESQSGFAMGGNYDVAAAVELADGTQLSGLTHVNVANGSLDTPTPSLLVTPSGVATVGTPYEPLGKGAPSRGLLVSGMGPFAFGAVAPSPSNVIVDGAGNLQWTPTASQVGAQRLAVRIVDQDGHETTRDWVVAVAPQPERGCSVAPPRAGVAAGLALLGLLCLLGYGAMVRQSSKQGTKRSVPPVRLRPPTAPPV